MAVSRNFRDIRCTATNLGNAVPRCSFVRRILLPAPGQWHESHASEASDAEKSAPGGALRPRHEGNHASMELFATQVCPPGRCAMMAGSGGERFPAARSAILAREAFVFG